MSPGVHTEREFENRVEAELLRGGWVAGGGTYAADLGIDTGALWAFISQTQLKPWKRLLELYGGDQDTAMRQFGMRVAAEIDARGVLDVLRNGVKDRGVKMELAYFRPAHTLASDALAEYNENVLEVARQLHFSYRAPRLSVDLALLVNGLPVATVELKNGMTGQKAEDAMAQYRDRDPSDTFFARRTLVHFAVDPERAFVTTRLRGKNTEFLPFNTGSAGPGNPGGAGNPPQKPGRDYPVAYLWRDIWQRDNWLEILQRYLHVEAVDEKLRKVNPHTSKRIFPRFHQWHAVREMVAHARANGTGSNYLVEHSAGSGKSNTIAWLSYQLSGLFDDANEQVFHKVIVITDRNVLDKQLQRTISQFDHTPGVVKRIDEDSVQLAEALEDSTSKIIISTLHKYSYILDKITGQELHGKRYAVIIDEAHSSQGGDAAGRLKQSVGANAIPPEDGEEWAAYLTRAHGPQPNLSYFAFTATPKSPTLQLFGTFDPEKVNPHTKEPGMYVPFHVYSMKQAIEEGFILDVLANYLTWQSKWRLRNAAVEAQESEALNPEVDKRKARAKLVRFAELHPSSLKQKAKLIVEDFREELAGRMAGRAKAMVVCTGRQHAFDMYQAIRDWDRTLPGCGFGVLVAFSGSLKDKHSGLDFTEQQLNGFAEGQLPDRFGYVKADDPKAADRNQDEYRILIVADKYQTGFDQPLLCGMYVDKPLTGVAAVQTLSRLNRTHPRKTTDDVRILDFVNEAHDIAAAFEPWFEMTSTPETDPNLVYTREREVMDFGVIVVSEMESFIRVLGEAGTARKTPAAETKLHAKLHSYLQPAVDRFSTVLETNDAREDFRAALQDFVRLYSLMGQIVAWGDEELERLYQYGRLLLIRLPGPPATSVDIGDSDLSHYRLEFTGRHNVSLSGSGGGADGVVRGYSSDGGSYKDPDYMPMAELIAELNERFGTDLGTSDKILIDQQVAGLVDDPRMQKIAESNDETRFGQVADDRLDDIVAENAERNTEFMKHYFDNDEFRQAIKEATRRRAYRIITDPARDEALARLRAEMARDTAATVTRSA